MICLERKRERERIKCGCDDSKNEKVTGVTDKKQNDLESV